MDIALPSFILGYHGCDAKVAADVVAGKAQLEPSTNDYDWLADGIYFWEHNAQRAYDFAKQMRKNPHPSGQKIKAPAVVGAVIDLGPTKTRNESPLMHYRQRVPGHPRASCPCHPPASRAMHPCHPPITK